DGDPRVRGEDAEGRGAEGAGRGEEGGGDEAGREGRKEAGEDEAAEGRRRSGCVGDGGEEAAEAEEGEEGKGRREVVAVHVADYDHVNDDVRRRQRRLSSVRCEAAADPGDEIRVLERLADELLRAGREGPVDDVLARPRRDDEHRDRPGARVLLQL